MREVSVGRPAAADTFVSEPAHITRTSAELIGRKALPRALAERPVVYVLGPAGVGKTTVARRLAGADALVIDAVALRGAVARRARDGRFPPALVDAPVLVIDGVQGLYARYGFVDLLGELLRGRAELGRRTILVEGRDDRSLSVLFGPVPLAWRASVLLRFPVGSGRKKHVLRRCAERGLPFARGRHAVTIDPWTYEAVERALDAAVATG